MRPLCCQTRGSLTPMRRMRWRVLVCQTTPNCQRTVTFTVSLAGSKTSTSSAQRTTTSCTRPTVSTLMALRTTTRRSTILRWPTTSSSARTLQEGQLLARKKVAHAALVHLDGAAQCHLQASQDSARIALPLSPKLPKWMAPFTIHPSCCKKSPAISSRWSMKLRRQCPITRERFPSCARTLTQNSSQRLIRAKHGAPLGGVAVLSAPYPRSKTARRLSTSRERCEERLAGTTLCSPSPPTTQKCTLRCVLSLNTSERCSFDDLEEDP